MEKARYILGGLIMFLAFSLTAQLAPDQNPNYMNSAEKYAQQSDELTASQSTTVHDTYEAYDWREAKAEEKRLRQERRYELRKLRYQTRNRCYRNSFYNNGYYNNGFYHNYNTPYYNGYYNSEYYNSYFGQPNCGNLLYGTGLGLGLYYLLN